METDLDHEIESFLRAAFDENFDWLSAETGAGLAPDIREMAFQQAIFYWRRLKDIALKVTETEVRLNLPGLVSPGGREYGIEGIVDIVREADTTTMYDIKTHNPEYVRAHLEDYAKQLNVYAHIWRTLREQDLDATAVIATSFPDALREAIARGDEARIAVEMERWKPVIPIPYDEGAVEQAVGEFGQVIDLIEEGNFEPRSVEVLKGRPEDGARTFATRVCRNCDARFSCTSYRLYMQSVAGAAELKFQRFFGDEDLEWDAEARFEILLQTADGVGLDAELVG